MARSNEIFSSWPASAFVAGVKIGSGNSDDSWRPAGSLIPQTACRSWYSFHPEPARYPRTTHSMGSGLAFFTIMLRRASLSANGCRLAGNESPSWETTWFGWKDSVWPNQKYEICVSTSPLRGTPLGRITSNAEIRSVATNNRLSPKSKTSRTLPLLSFLTPGRSRESEVSSGMAGI